MPVRSLPFDSVDNEPLPTETKPLNLVIEDKAYELYLSEEHRKELDSVLEKFLKHEEPIMVQEHDELKTTKKKASDSESFKEWSKRMGHEGDREHFIKWAEENGKTLARQGKVSQEFRTEYEEAHGGK